MKNTPINLLMKLLAIRLVEQTTLVKSLVMRSSIAVSRARSLLAYLYGMSRCSLRGSLRLNLLATISAGVL